MNQKERKGHFFHVTYDSVEKQWYVKEVKGKDIGSFKTKDEAVKKAEGMAKKEEMGHVVIHNERGRFETIENF